VCTSGNKRCKTTQTLCSVGDGDAITEMATHQRERRKMMEGCEQVYIYQCSDLYGTLGRADRVASSLTLFWLCQGEE
jgi:hypothetical protein